MTDRIHARAFAESERMKNATERAFALYLEAERAAGRIKRWDYEPERLRLGPGTYYTPDFRVVGPDDRVTMFECKGFMREAARVRVRVASERHPYRFVVVRRERRGGEWTFEEVG